MFHKSALTFLVFVVTSSFGQTVERVSKAPKVSEAKSKLTDSVRWDIYDGQWKVNPIEPTGLELREVTIAGKTYMVLVRETLEHDYKYPKARIGGYLYDGTRYYLFDKSKLANLISENPEFNKAYVVNLGVLLRAKGRRTNNAEEMAGDIYRFLDIYGDVGKQPDIELLFGVFPVIHENKKKVRYLFREQDSMFKPQFKPTDFDIGYYEVDFDNFLRFVKGGISKPDVK